MQVGKGTIQDITRVYFLGIGGIGMSALARYFKHYGAQVAGYDLTESAITTALQAEGVSVHYTDDEALIPEPFRVPSPGTLIVYTPAVPLDNREVRYLQDAGHVLHKRAEVLGHIAARHRTLAIAGTHGKTTTSTMLAHVLHCTIGCNAILGGIGLNAGSNLILGAPSAPLVVEADEYDRSFLQLSPEVSVVTAVAADHLDIYGNLSNLERAFREFAERNTQQRIITHVQARYVFERMELGITTYGLQEEADYRASDVELHTQSSTFTLHRPQGDPVRLSVGVPGEYNVENAVACVAAAEAIGVPAETLREHLATFRGVQRRFEVRYTSPRVVYIDDYAHHPDEIRALIAAARAVYPDRDVTGIFQPHLYTRTRDLANDFARALSGLDTLLLLPIYPARELPIEGVTSKMLLELVPHNVKKMLVQPESLDSVLKALPIDLLLTMGAGSIGLLAGKIARILQEKETNYA